MIMLNALSTPWMLMMDASGAASPASDSTSALTSAAIGGGSEGILLTILAVALVGGVVAMVAGDRVRRAEGAGRVRSEE